VIDHLGFDLQLLVGAEEGVVHQVPVVARDVGGRPDGIQHLQVGLCHEPQGPMALLSVDRWRTKGCGGGRRNRTAEHVSATEAIHLTLHLGRLA
jgi:hypothetical protein